MKITNRKRLENNIEENKQAVQDYLGQEQPPKALPKDKLPALLPKSTHFSPELISQETFAGSIAQLTRMRDERMGIICDEKVNADGSIHIIRDAREAKYVDGPDENKNIPPVNGVESFYIQHLNIARSALFMLDERLKNNELPDEARLRLESAKDNLSRKVQDHMQDMNKKFEGYIQNEIFSDKEMKQTTLDFNKEVCDILESGGVAKPQKDLNSVKDQVAIFNEHCHFSTITEAKDEKGNTYNKVENDTLLVGITDEQRDMFEEIKFFSAKTPQIAEVELKFTGDEGHENKPSSKQAIPEESKTGHEWYDTLTKDQKALALLYIDAALEGRPIRLSSQVMSLLPTLRNAAITTTMLSKEAEGKDLEVLSQHSHSGVPAYLGKGDQEGITKENIKQLKSFFPDKTKINDVMLISPANFTSDEPRMAELMRGDGGVEVTSTPFNIFRFPQTIRRAFGFGKDDYAPYIKTLQGVGKLIEDHDQMGYVSEYLKTGKNLETALSEIKNYDPISLGDWQDKFSKANDKIAALCASFNLEDGIKTSVMKSFLELSKKRWRINATSLTEAFNDADKILEEKLKVAGDNTEAYNRIKDVKGEIQKINTELFDEVKEITSERKALCEILKIAVEARRVIDDPSLIKDIKDNTNLMINDLMQEVQNSAHLNTGALNKLYGEEAKKVVPITHSHCKSGKDREGINRFFNSFKSVARKLGLSEEKNLEVYKENLQLQAVGGHTQFSADIYTGTPGTQKESNFAQPKFFKDNMKGLQQDTAGFNKLKVNSKHKTPEKYLVGEQQLKDRQNPMGMIDDFANAQTRDGRKVAAERIIANQDYIPKNFKHFVDAAQSFIENNGMVKSSRAASAAECEEFANNLKNGSTKSIYGANNFVPMSTNIYNQAMIGIYKSGRDEKGNIVQGDAKRAVEGGIAYMMNFTQTKTIYELERKLQGLEKKNVDGLKQDKEIIDQLKKEKENINSLYMEDKEKLEKGNIEELKIKNLHEFIRINYPQTLHLIAEGSKTSDYQGLSLSGEFFMSQDPNFIDRWQNHHALKEDVRNQIKIFIEGGMKNPEKFEISLKNAAKTVMEIVEADVKMMPEKCVDFDVKTNMLAEKPQPFSVGKSKDELLADLKAKSEALKNKPLSLTSQIIENGKDTIVDIQTRLDNAQAKLDNIQAKLEQAQNQVQSKEQPKTPIEPAPVVQHSEQKSSPEITHQENLKKYIQESSNELDKVIEDAKKSMQAYEQQKAPQAEIKDNIKDYNLDQSPKVPYIPQNLAVEATTIQPEKTEKKVHFSPGPHREVGTGEHTKKFAKEKETPIMSLHRVKSASSHLEAAKESKLNNNAGLTP